MERTIRNAIIATAILALGVAVSGSASASARHSHHTGQVDRIAACGVERWAVKTGIDPVATLEVWQAGAGAGERLLASTASGEMAGQDAGARKRS